MFGNDHSITIQMDRQEFYGGDTVTGSICLSIIKPQSIDAVFLKLKGHNEVTFEYTAVQKGSDGKSKIVTRSTHQKKTFWKQKYTVHGYKCVLQPGTFMFPFQFVLERNLPASFGTFSQKYTGKVFYELEAEVGVPGTFTFNLRHSQEIILRQPPPPLLAVNSYKEAKVTFLCCVPKGHVSMALSMDKDGFPPGQVAQLRILVDNSASQVDLKGVKISLNRTIKLYSNGHSHVDKTSVSKSLSVGVPKGERSDRLVQLQIPSRLESSTDTNLVKCSYSLVAELSVPWSLNMQIVQPVTIYEELLISAMVLSTPPNWSPVVMPLAQLESAPPYESLSPE